MSVKLFPLSSRILIFLFLTAAISLTAQNFESIAIDHVVSNPRDFSTNVNDASKLLVVNKHTTAASQLTHVYMNQLHNGMKIHNAIANVSLDADGNVFHTGNRLVNHPKTTVISPTLNAIDAVKSVAASFGQAENNQTTIVSQDGSLAQKTILSNSNIAKNEIRGELMYVVENGSLVLSWLINYVNESDSRAWETKVNALNGDIVDQILMTIECKFGPSDDPHDHDNHDHYYTESKNTSTKKANASVVNGDYFVSPIPNESPQHGPLGTVNSPWTNNLDPAANPFTGALGQSWHNDGNTTYFTTRGNNAWAVEDLDNDNAQQGGFSPPSQLGTTGQQYNYVPDFTMDPTAYQEALITNLFYWSNIAHDVSYHYGFNEECGNFQETNDTGLGLGGDPLFVDAIDGSGFNNANYMPSPDGVSSRVQMFQFMQPLGPPPLNTTLTGTLSQTIGGFAENFANVPWTAANDGPLVLAIDNAGTNEACGTPIPGDISNAAALSGNVALIDRGSCAFTEKVENAEAAGAIGVVICNNVATDPIVMQGTPSMPISIPAIMISMADCNTIKANLPGVSLSFDQTVPLPVGPPNRTSDYDNGIILHEYAHGISIRLTGGAATTACLSLGDEEQMGEGWSDYFALVLTMKPGDMGTTLRPIGTYATGNPVTGPGFRPAPYTIDMAVNSLTYGNTDDGGAISIPHGVGTVWATMLWDMTWDLINIYGFGTDIYESNIGNPGFGGQNLALRLVIEALKLQPCNPGFVDGRDAILAADLALYNGDHQCLIWNAFARRGLGVSAVQGSSAIVADNVEAFDVPDVNVEKLASSPLTVDGTSVSWDITADISECSGASGGVTIVDNVDPSLIITSVMCPAPAVSTTNGNMITITHPGFGGATGSFACTVVTTVNTMTIVPPSQQFLNDVESGTAGWTVNDITGAGAGPWVISSSASNSPSNSWFASNTDGPDKTTALESPTFSLGASPTLKFFHQFDTEAGWDGGYVEVSSDGGATWIQLVAADFIANGYNSVLGSNMNTDISGKDAWSGDSGGFIETVAHLGTYANSDVQIRFVFGQDDNTNEVGWWVDDIEITEGEYTVIENTACISPDGSADEFCSTASTCVEIVQQDCPPGTLGLSGSSTEASCTTGFDGTATVAASGGVAPYTYLWSNNQTGATAVFLGAGTYSVTVTDANGCVDSINVTVTALSVDCPLDPSIPTMGEWGLMSLCLLLLIFGVVRIKEQEQSLATE